jgi:ankyrin repeat protein
VLVESGAKDADGATALHQAALFGHVEVLRVLVESGVNKESKAAGGATALQACTPGGRQRARGGDTSAGAAWRSVRCTD